jgi:phytanoyl-CoA hydroxylase
MLAGAQVEQYNTQGYCVVEGLLSQDQIAGLVREMDAVCAGATLADHDSSRLEMEPNQAPDGTRVRRFYEPCTNYDLFRSFSESGPMLDPLEQLLGPDILYFSSKINVKPAEIGSVVEWHQDMAFGPVTNRSVLAVLIYLDDADLENGCLQVLPGKYDMLNHSRDGYFQGRVTEAFDTSNAVPVEAKAGAGIFFNGLTPHASAPNRSSRSRRTLILGYRAADSLPIHLDNANTETERFVRLVRGKKSNVARFDMDSIYIPRYPEKTRSLYELQDLSRRDEATQTM